MNEWQTVEFTGTVSTEQAVVTGGDGRIYLAIRHNGEFVSDVDITDLVNATK